VFVGKHADYDATGTSILGLGTDAFGFDVKEKQHPTGRWSGHGSLKLRWELRGRLLETRKLGNNLLR